MGSLFWASNREYADLQRTYGYIAGILGVGVAFLLLLIATCLAVRERRDDDG